MSRSQAKTAIRAGRISVNGRVVKDPAYQLTESESVVCDDAPVAAAGFSYLMLNKPLGVVSATRDDLHKTVVDLIGLEQHQGLHPAGRLDIDTSGLVLLTNDGDWSHRVTAPNKKCPKSYRVELADKLPMEAIRRLEQGIELKNEEKPTLPAIVELKGNREIVLTIHEGKYHQVKRMLAAVGNRVVALHRERIGDIVLDDSLKPGEYRSLTDKEIASIL